MGKGVIEMMNMSIHCDVTECKYHDKTEKYCTLNAINVCHDKSKDGTLEADCGSYERA